MNHVPIPPLSIGPFPPPPTLGGDGGGGGKDGVSGGEGGGGGTRTLRGRKILSLFFFIERKEVGPKI